MKPTPGGSEAQAGRQGTAGGAAGDVGGGGGAAAAAAALAAAAAAWRPVPHMSAEEAERHMGLYWSRQITECAAGMAPRLEALRRASGGPVPACDVCGGG